jgi:hypothetical protein
MDSKLWVLIQVLSVWTLSIVSSCLYLEHNVSETEFCPRLQLKPTLLGPINRANPYRLDPTE